MNSDRHQTTPLADDAEREQWAFTRVAVCIAVAFVTLGVMVRLWGVFT